MRVDESDMLLTAINKPEDKVRVKSRVVKESDTLPAAIADKIQLFVPEICGMIGDMLLERLNKFQFVLI